MKEHHCLRHVVYNWPADLPAYFWVTRKQYYFLHFVENHNNYAIFKAYKALLLFFCEQQNLSVGFPAKSCWEIHQHLVRSLIFAWQTSIDPFRGWQPAPEGGFFPRTQVWKTTPCGVLTASLVLFFPAVCQSLHSAISSFSVGQTWPPLYCSVISMT